MAKSTINWNPADVRKKYGIDANTGFLLTADKSISDEAADHNRATDTPEYLKPKAGTKLRKWYNTANNLRHIIAAAKTITDPKQRENHVRTKILEKLEDSNLDIDYELTEFNRRSPKPTNEEIKSFQLQIMRDVAFVAQAWIWQEKPERLYKIENKENKTYIGDRELPQFIAKPLLNLSKKIGIPPNLSYATYIMVNGYRNSADWPDNKLDVTPSHFSVYHTFGVPDTTRKDKRQFGEKHFITTHMAIETNGVVAFEAICKMLEAFHNKSIAEKDKNNIIKQGFSNISESLKAMIKNIRSLYDNLDLDDFAHFRLYLGGTTDFGPEGSKRGLIFKGTEDEGKPKSMEGGSGAQTPLFQMIDIFLGIIHGGQTTEFFNKQAAFHLPKHREFINEVKESAQCLRKYIGQQNDTEITKALNDAITELGNWRKSHHVATKQFVGYGKGTGENHDIAGSGGASLLETVRDETMSSATNGGKPQPTPPEAILTNASEQPKAPTAAKPPNRQPF